MKSGTKNVADDFHRIAVWTLIRDARKHNFKPMKVIWGDDTNITCQVSMPPQVASVRFSYIQKDALAGETRHLEYDILLQQSPCHFGGYRYWFSCGLTRDGKCCGKRVGVLYKCGDYFACRNCFNLTYRSRNDNRRGKSFPMLHFLDVDAKVHALEKRVGNRRLYAGKLTKKAKRLGKLLARSNVTVHQMFTVENYG